MKHEVEKSRSSELAVLTRSGFYKIRDNQGAEHRMHLIDMQDLADLHARFGTADVDQGDPAVYQFLVWAAIRKNGCTAEELDRGEYKVSLAQVGRMFTMADLKFGGGAKMLNQVLFASGLSVPDRKTGEAAPPEGLDPNVPWTAEYIGGRLSALESGQPLS